MYVPIRFRQLEPPPGRSIIEGALGRKPNPAIAASGGDSHAEFLPMTHWADAARTPDKQRLIEVASILAAGILGCIRAIRVIRG